MAGKQFHARPASATSRRLFVAAAALLLLLAAFYFLLSPSSPGPAPTLLASPIATTSFLASLDRFLAAPHPSASSPAAPGDLDAAIRAQEEARLYGEPGSPWPAAAAGPLRVYVYDMPAKFTYDLLRLFRDSYRETDNLTSNGSPVHRLIEQVGVW
jgi:hypothetical protein